MVVVALALVVEDSRGESLKLWRDLCLCMLVLGKIRNFIQLSVYSTIWLGLAEFSGVSYLISSGVIWFSRFSVLLLLLRKTGERRVNLKLWRDICL